ncbi:MAG: hypothetical protein AUJ98_03010 [Bacteroidetes bacterium CG2_30_33_31]|nr:MAG: hypothetical protein AUJ98_03010 [Bacteroidetes bacterium CG2_30_33_31]
MSSNIQNIRKSYQANPYQALEKINNILKIKITKDALLLRAEINQQLSRNTDALNDYTEVMTIFGVDDETLYRKQLLAEIIEMTQIDIYSCPNLHKDPWE